MDYAEARAAFFSARETPVEPLAWTTPARRLRDAIEPIATICFWSEPAYDAYAAVGLDFLGGYVWGRACPLGEPDAGVVVSTFGVFEPGLIASTYDAARGSCSLADIRAAKARGAGEALRAVLGDPADADGLVETTGALRSATAAAPRPGRALFAGLAGLPWPEDPWQQLWHACGLLREHRGDGHLAALVVAGLSGIEANLLTEAWVGWEPLAYAGSRAWSPEDLTAATTSLEERGLVHDGALTDAGRALREEIESRTDDAEAAVVAALGDDLETHVARLDAWAGAVVAHGWFPPDPFKRASG